MSSEEEDSEFGPEATPTDPNGAVPVEFTEPITAAHALPELLHQARMRGYETASTHVVEQLTQAREEVIDTCRQLFVIFEVPFPAWEAAERWIRARLTPL